MEVPSLPSPNPPYPEATKTAPSPVKQPLSSMTSLLTKSKNSHKTPKPASTKAQALSDDPMKKKDKVKRQKKTATPITIPLPMAPILVEDSSREGIGLSDRENRTIPPAQISHAILSTSPCSGQFGADALYSPAIASLSP